MLPPQILSIAAVLLILTNSAYLMSSRDSLDASLAKTVTSSEGKAENTKTSVEANTATISSSKAPYIRKRGRLNVQHEPFEAWIDERGLVDIRAPIYRKMLDRRVKQAIRRDALIPPWVLEAIADYD